MENKEYIPFNSLASVEEREKSYDYTFDPPLSSNDVETLSPDIKNFVKKNLVPNGGGFALGKNLAFSKINNRKRQNRKKLAAGMTVSGTPETVEEDEMDEKPDMNQTIMAHSIVLVIPKTTMKHQVDQLFSMLQQEGLEIFMTIEDYPPGDNRLNINSDIRGALQKNKFIDGDSKDINNNINK